MKTIAPFLCVLVVGRACPDDRPRQDSGSAERVARLEVSTTRRFALTDSGQMRPVTSEDGSTILFVRTRAGQQYVLVNGRAGRMRDSIPFQQIRISSDGRHYAFLERRADGKLSVVMDDSVQGPFYDDVPRSNFTGTANPALSPDGRRLAYVARRGGRSLVVVDGREGPEYELAYGVQFDPTSGRVLYVAQREGRRFVVVDGIEQRAYARIESPVFSPDGRHVAYGAADSVGAYVVVDGAAEVSYPEGSRVSFVSYAPDSRRLAHVVLRGMLMQVVVDGQAGKGYPSIGPVQFSPDSRRFAYVALGDSVAWMVVDGLEGPGAVQFFDFQFSADSRHFAYTSQRGPEFRRVLDHRPGPAHTRIVAGSLRFSPDGAHLAYVSEEEAGGEQRQRAYLDNRAGAPYQSVSNPVFSADSRLLAYAARGGRGHHVVVNGFESRTLPQLDTSALIFEAPRGLRIPAYPRGAVDWVHVIVRER